jgi:hypothetical protein
MSNLELLSHEKLRKGLFSEDLIESLPEIACIFDTAGRLKQWNGNFESDHPAAKALAQASGKQS